MHTKRLVAELVALRARMLALESEVLAAYPRIDAGRVRSACNLAHYAALRSRENRAMQNRLARLGYSSLGRAEGSVLANVDAVLRLAATAAGAPAPALEASRGPVPLLGGRRLLERASASLLGPTRPERSERILVTLPPEAAHDAAFVQGLAAAGMDCARINCAHDDADAWSSMVRNVRRAAKATHRPIRILMDLAGPKVRTGPLTPGPDVLHWRPRRDDLGRPVEPARILLVPIDAPATAIDPAHAVLPVTSEWLARRRAGDTVRLVDARGSIRKVRVEGTAGLGRWATSLQSAYVVGGTRLEATGPDAAAAPDVGVVGRLTPMERPILLHRGDEVVVTRSLEPGACAQRDAAGAVIAAARIGCTLPEALDSVRPGHSIWFDDGKIGGIVVAASREEVRVRVEHASPTGDRLRADKGINLPDTPIDVPALTSKDVGDLRFVVAHADMVAQSFVRSRADVEDLAARLASLGRASFGTVLKIETRQAFDRLPEILFASMRSPLTGVMIARGDLAVECGWERLAELQEEILWFCEAAHMPVIWATQVLDGMARTGRPSRAEVTDAAMSVRAECVMLNKGPFVRDAIETLDRILHRMEGHQSKKRTLLRRLHVAERFDPAAARRAGRNSEFIRAERSVHAGGRTSADDADDQRAPRTANPAGHSVPPRSARAATPRPGDQRSRRADARARAPARAVCVDTRDAERRRVP